MTGDSALQLHVHICGPHIHLYTAAEHLMDQAIVLIKHLA